MADRRPGNSPMPLTITDGTHTARVAPELGGTVLTFWSWRGQDVLHWLWPIPDEVIGRTLVPKGGSFVLAPYSNRMTDARLAFRGRGGSVAPHPDTGSHGQHGHAARTAWAVTDARPDRVAMTLAADLAAWPWRLRLEQVIAIADGALACSLTAVSEDDAPMPVGLGFHPFFTRGRGQRLVTDASTVHATDMGSRPIAAEPTGATRDMPASIDVDPLRIGRFLSGWSGRAKVTWPALEAAVAIEADPAILPYLLLFCPESRPFICVEPVSHLTGALQLPEAQGRAQGLRVLEPGDRLEARMVLRPLLQG